MKILKIVLVLCILNTFIIAQEENTRKENSAKEPSANTAIVNGKMSQDIRDHFTAEKEASLYYLGVGAVTTMKLMDTIQAQLAKKVILLIIPESPIHFWELVYFN